MPTWRPAIFPLRWPIMIVCGLMVAGAWAARRDRDKSAPPPEPAPAPGPIQPEPEPDSERSASEPAPTPDQVHVGPLFPDGLPMPTLELPDGLANPTSQACAACHGELTEAWAGSAHATAWQAERYLQAVRDASQPTSCLACHLPYEAQHPDRVVQHAGGDPAMPHHEPNPAWSPTLQREGVGCATCHLREGAILGPRGSTAAPHPTRASEDLASPALCAACHQLSWPGSDTAWYDTYGEWYRSPYRAAGVRCQDCHMAQRAATVTTGRFASHPSHALSVDPARAVSILLDLDSPRITRGEPFAMKLRVQNTGAGHAFPTGHPGKSYILAAVVVSSEDEPLHEPFEHALVRNVEPDPPHALLEDSRIPARGELVLEHETTILHKKPAGPAALRVTIRREGEERTIIVRSFPVTVL